MPDRSPATDRRYREEAADDGYFAPLAQGRYFLLDHVQAEGRSRVRARAGGRRGQPGLLRGREPVGRGSGGSGSTAACR